MSLLPALPNIRYIRLLKHGKPLDLFRLDGTDEELDHALAHMRDVYSYTDPELTVLLLDKYEGLELEWQFIYETCIPWEDAQNTLEGFEVSINWN